MDYYIRNSSPFLIDFRESEKPGAEFVFDQQSKTKMLSK